MHNTQLPTFYQQFIHKSRYARWLDDKGRREEWHETVERYFDYLTKWLREKHNYNVTSTDRHELEEAVLNLEIMPSMRALMTAGPALERDHMAAYNCSYIQFDDVNVFHEILYILMCGTGVGFSVERNAVDQLPIVPADLAAHDSIILVEDSREGWARAFRLLVESLYEGKIKEWDMSAVRPAGERLKTFGGRSSGSGPLDELFRFTTDVFKKAAGRRLYPIECHDIACKIGEIVVAGGVRRSALISLSNLNDDQMRHAKAGSWWVDHKQRALANNSAAYKFRPDAETFLREWTALVESKSGERGIFNRAAAKAKAAENGRRDADRDFGCNPCSEIILRPDGGTCNLSEVVVREYDTEQSIERKVRLATKLGTWQATLTNFTYVRDVWRKNAEEERLLGVSLTGIMDNQLLSGRSAQHGKNIQGVLNNLRQAAIDTNKTEAQRIGINQSAAITCIKPSGTVSQLVDAASGIHARHSERYIRTVRGSNNDPLTQFMTNGGINAEADVMNPSDTTVFSFAIEAPKGCVTRNEMTAIEQLEMWLLYARHWCEHKPSVTISVKDDEWMDVGAWVWKHFDECSGISFLPHSEHTYQQAPYQDATEEQLDELRANTVEALDWSQLEAYEADDNTKGSQELACSAGVCEVVDLQ